MSRDDVIEDVAFYKEWLWSLEHAELDGRLCDRDELQRTIKMCKRRIKDIESRPSFPPQCATLASQPGVYGRAGWADQDDEGRLA